MGGAAGHLLHLSEDLELTFGELKDILSLAADGKLERVTEKTDGVNLVFTWNESTGELRAARSSGDLHRGGVDAVTLATKFRDRGNVTDAFVTGFNVLRNAVGALTDKQRLAVFGPEGNRWFSVEIIYSLLPNVVNYDRDYVVFHGHPVFEVRDSKAIEVDGSNAIRILEANVDKMQAAVKERSWRIMGTSVVSMKKLSSGATLDNALSMLASAMSRAGVNDGNTLGEYLVALARDEALDAGLPEDIALDVGKRMVGVPGQNVTQLRKRAGTLAATVNDLVAGADESVKRFLEPIDRAIFELSLEVLRGVKSVLLPSQDEELVRLRKQVQQAIAAIEASGDKNAMGILRAQMTKLGSVDRISSPIEGVVFVYKGQAYKFTGSFTPVHKILSLFKFGRGGTKLEMPKESVRRRRLIEGGGSFDNAEQISLEEYQDTLPDLKRDLEALGAAHVEPIGSTGKKQLMGDLDFAVEFDGGAAELFDLARAAFGPENVKKTGGSVVSVLYPVQSNGRLTGAMVQVDLMVGNVSYVSWARSGSSTIKHHVDFSAVKGVIKNLLLNVIARFASRKLLEQPDDPLERRRYAFDFDRGLFLQHQTKHSKRGGTLTNWKTLSAEMVTDDPDEIIEVLLGLPAAASAARTVESLIKLVRRSPTLKSQAEELLDEFVISLQDTAERDPRLLGPNPLETVATVQGIIEGSDT